MGPWGTGATSIGQLMVMAAGCQAHPYPGTAAYGILRIAGEFTAGCGVLRLFRQRVGSTWSWNWLTPALLISIFVFSNLLMRADLLTFWIAPLLAALLLGLSYHQCLFSRFLSTRPLLIGGYISYSVAGGFEP